MLNSYLKAVKKGFLRNDTDVDEILIAVKVHLLGETEEDAEESEPGPEETEEQSSS